jgi:hypothetical protein
MEGNHVSKIVRLRLFVALGLIAAVLIAAGPNSVSAAGGPMVHTSYYYPAPHCTSSGGEDVCTTSSDDSYKHLMVLGNYFTPNGAAELWVVLASTNQVLSHFTFHANAQGNWGFRFGDIKLCTGGKRLIVYAIDKSTGRQSNVANAFKCGPTL